MQYMVSSLAPPMSVPQNVGPELAMETFAVETNTTRETAVRLMHEVAVPFGQAVLPVVVGGVLPILVGLLITAGCGMPS